MIVFVKIRSGTDGYLQYVTNICVCKLIKTCGIKTWITLGIETLASDNNNQGMQ